MFPKPQLKELRRDAPEEYKRLTFRPASVKLLHPVIESDAHGGEAHLSLKARHQAIVQAPWSLRLHHGFEGAKHAPVFPPFCIVEFRLPLDLRRKEYLELLLGLTHMQNRPVCVIYSKPTTFKLIKTKQILEVGRLFICCDNSIEL